MTVTMTNAVFSFLLKMDRAMALKITPKQLLTVPEFSNIKDTTIRKIMQRFRERYPLTSDMKDTTTVQKSTMIVTHVINDPTIKMVPLTEEEVINRVRYFVAAHPDDPRGIVMLLKIAEDKHILGKDDTKMGVIAEMIEHIAVNEQSNTKESNPIITP